MSETNTYDAGYFLATSITKGSKDTALDIAYSFNTQKGTLNNRENKTFNWRENFTYDELDRLTTWQDPKGINSNTYDNFSRITQNNEVGSYGYDPTTRYKKNQIELNTAGNTYYKTRSTQQIAYDINQNPVKITETGKPTLYFIYDPEGNRVEAYQTIIKTEGILFKRKKEVVIKSNLYKSDNSVEIETTPEEVKRRFFLPWKKKVTPATNKFITYLAGSPYDAQMVYSKKYNRTNNLTAEEGVFYLHRDYLGSILAISNSNGVTIERRQFDAWGNLTKLEINGKETTDTNQMFTQRGYTGHEHFYANGIIHMNGRIYDPKLRTFLSPDINLLEPENSQHYNRYSYGLNNPLMYTDPSGDELYSMPSYNIPTYSFPLYNIPFNSMSSTNMISFLNSFNVANFVSTGYGYLDNLFNPYSPGDPFLMDKNMQSTNDYLNDIDFNNPNIIELEEIVIKGKPMTDLISSPIKDLTGNVNWDGINNSLQVADGFGFGAAMGKQFSIDYRLSQSLIDRVGMSANIKAIDFLGTASNWLGRAGNAGLVLGTYFDYKSYTSGQISGERFGYNLTGNLSSFGVGLINPIAGGVVGSSFYVGQQFYDGYMY